MIIRNNTNRDRYAKAALAAALSSEKFNNEFDVAHVKHKFPYLVAKGEEWLAVRMGEAITQRRQYLKYCRDHHEKTLRGPQPKTHPVEVTPSHQVFTKLPTDGRSVVSKPPSTLAVTQASTLLLTSNVNVEEELEQDSQSQTSYATSVEEESSDIKLHVIPLEDVAKGALHFECTYCWQIQAFKTQKAWK
jgi:hypothetical protein